MEDVTVYAKENETNHDWCWFTLILPPRVFKGGIPPGSELY